jgi:hypothetical protein
MKKRAPAYPQAENGSIRLHTYSSMLQAQQSRAPLDQAAARRAGSRRSMAARDRDLAAGMRRDAPVPRAMLQRDVHR